jgi:hypothetical protein
VTAAGCGGTSKRSVDGTGDDGGAGATGGTSGGTSGSGAKAGGGTGAIGAAGCVQVPCVNILPECPDGNIVVPTCGCATCSCEGLTCTTPDCPAGEVPGRLPGACCDSCIPDPNTCDISQDCVIGKNVKNCCPCPEAISRLKAADDVCWEVQNEPPHPVPSSCYPEACPAVECVCPQAPAGVDCFENQCVATYPVPI